MVMLFVETEQSQGSKSGNEEDGLSFTDVEFEVWGAFRWSHWADSWIHGFEGQQRSLDWIYAVIGGERVDSAGGGSDHLGR